jgi:hypothetical protein
MIGDSPFRFDETAPLKPVQSGVECAFLEVERSVGDELNPLPDPGAVGGLPA